MHRSPLFSTLALAALALGALSAADLHVLPQATGDASGSNWDNALAANNDDLSARFAALAPGDGILLGSGTYPAFALQLAGGGTAEAPVRLHGVDTGAGLPEIYGTWQRNNPKTGSNGFVLQAGLHHADIANFRCRNYQRVVTGTDGGLSDLRFSGLDIESVRNGFYLVGSPSANNHHLVIEDCSIRNYTKRAVRFQNGNHTILVRNVSADAGGQEWAVERFAIGFHVVGAYKASPEDKANSLDHHIRFESCSSRGHYDDNGDKYWNADGFAAEGGSHNLVYVDCLAENNTDGGWDDKSTNPLLIGCSSKGNKRNYRFWSKDNRATLIDCRAEAALKTGGSGDATAIWSNGPVLF
nr:hypothetical protein [Planctomycetota bacterium]